ncbi:class I SAM-dependent methyltransferase [Candidatus Leptofilum sp.]|uniref:class I SAM-dependent methyltransferase n=1 Tax=Candidatus Leptofilum sp. TaxID=3241576 RepID=UPI003B5CDA07
MHPKLLYFRYKLFKYRQVEQQVAQHLASQNPQPKLLDVGCGDGENMLRFDDVPLQRTGLEVSFSRLQTARNLGLDVMQASGTHLPVPNTTFDMIYVAHVLHHVADYEQVLAEMKRCLVANGRLFIVETVTDNPLLRLGRKVNPVWQGDEVEASWRFADLLTIFEKAGFVVEENGRYNILFFLWEMLPLAFWPFEIFTPIFVYLDLLLAKFFKKWSAHCYFVLGIRPETGD